MPVWSASDGPVAVPDRLDPMNTDGANYSPEVEVPPARATDWQALCYRQAAELARYRRLLLDAERRVPLGWWSSSVVDPFGETL